jgi:hypothetical protein
VLMQALMKMQILVAAHGTVGMAAGAGRVHAWACAAWARLNASSASRHSRSQSRRSGRFKRCVGEDASPQGAGLANGGAGAGGRGEKKERRQQQCTRQGSTLRGRQTEALDPGV